MKYIITESQYKTALMEQLSTTFRRRLDFDRMEDDMKSIIEDELLPCEFGSAVDFVSEACDLLAYRYIEDYNIPRGKESDSLYNFLVDLFGKQLVKIYNKKCS
jgi:hypothetical protein